jgi:hypothetical protein
VRSGLHPWSLRSFTTVFRFGHDLLVPTAIGNAFPQKLFLLDTGPLVNFISPAAASEVTKVQGNSDTIVTGISGQVEKVYSANKALLQFGHVRQENQDMTSIDMKAMSEGAGTETRASSDSSRRACSTSRLTIGMLW